MKISVKTKEQGALDGYDHNAMQCVWFIQHFQEDISKQEFL